MFPHQQSLGTMAGSSVSAMSVMERAFERVGSDAGGGIPTSWSQRSMLNMTSELVIGIDFGTTHTGVAYAHWVPGIVSNTRDVTRTQAALEAIADKVVLIKGWPMTNMFNLEKTPTVLAYENGTLVAWGGKVKSTHTTKVEFFKLGLQEGAGQHYRPRTDNIGSLALLGGFLDNPNWRHPNLPDKTAADFVEDYLREIRQCVRYELLERQMGSEFLQNERISYVLTVPAIWSYRARDLMRQAAERSGISGDRLVIITEPEAAALYCATVSRDLSLRQGDFFTVCDAGGGTVDLISYEIAALNPFSIRECTAGTGAACGSMYLNRGFEVLLRSRLGILANEILTPNTLEEAFSMFDTRIKFQFNPLSRDCEFEYRIPLPGARNSARIRLDGGFLRLSRTDIQNGIFDPVFSQILELVNEQIRNVRAATGRGIRALFLVGGLGSNRYLAQYLENKIGSGIVKQPANGMTAITRGAVLHRLGLNYVQARVLRLHYGIASLVPFEGHHPPSLRTEWNDGRIMCKDVMKWYAKKGERLPVGHRVEFSFHNDEFTEDDFNRPPFVRIMELLACADAEPPSYKNDRVRKICNILVDLNKLPLQAFEVRVGPRGTYYYHVEFQIAVTFGTEIEFKFMWGGVVIGEAKGYGIF